jgi:hypothetical protein
METQMIRPHFDNVLLASCAGRSNRAALAMVVYGVAIGVFWFVGVAIRSGAL